MGADAVQGSSNSCTDGNNGFKLPNELGNSINSIFTQQAIDVFPNPSKGNFRINASYNLQNVEFNLVDISGKKLSITAKTINENEAAIDVTSLNAGIYFLNIKSENGSITKKIIIE
jgi:LEA14-like dessication related protein